MAFIYVTEQGAVLQKRGRRLLVQKEGKLLLDMPAIKVEGVLIFGNVQFTTQALRLMLEENIEMALFSSRGRLLGQLTSPVTKNIALRKAQYARADDPDFALNMGLFSDSYKSEKVKRSDHPGLHDFQKLTIRFKIHEKRRDRILSSYLKNNQRLMN